MENEASCVALALKVWKAQIEFFGCGPMRMLSH